MNLIIDSLKNTQKRLNYSASFAAIMNCFRKASTNGCDAFLSIHNLNLSTVLALVLLFLSKQQGACVPFPSVDFAIQKDKAIHRRTPSRRHIETDKPPSVSST